MSHNYSDGTQWHGSAIVDGGGDSRGSKDDGKDYDNDSNNDR